MRPGVPPFNWNEIGQLHPLDSMSRYIMDEAREYGLKEGFSVPIVLGDAATVGFAIAGDHLEFGELERSDIVFAAHCAVARILDIRHRDAHAPPRKLSAKELEVLQWASEGFSLGKIADRMKITRHGVDFIMRAVRDKLSVHRVEHAVAEGFRQGMLR